MGNEDELFGISDENVINVIDVDEMDETELDSFLQKKAPEFINDLEKRETELSDSVKSATSKEKPKARLEVVLNKFLSKLSFLKNIKYFDRLIDFFNLLSPWSRVSNLFFDIKDRVSLWEKREWIIFSLITVVLFSGLFFISRFLKGESIKEVFFTPEVTSWGLVAEEVISFNIDSEITNTNIISNPDFIVLFERFILSLKPTKNSITPLASLKIHFNVEDEEAALLLKEEEKKVVHYLQRAIERLTYSQVSDRLGKSRLKNLVKNTVNTFLGREAVKGVYFKEIVLKR